MEKKKFKELWKNTARKEIDKKIEEINKMIIAYFINKPVVNGYSSGIYR